MPNRLLAVALLFACLAIAAGCGGGGGGGGGGSAAALTIPEVPFTSFAAVQANTTVVLSGISQTGNGTEVNTTASGNHVITSMNVGAVETSGTTVKLTYDANRSLTAMSVATPSSSFSLSRAAGDTITCSGGACVGQNAANTGGAIAADAFALGWNYQAFGIWEKDLSMTGIQIGAASVGNATPGSAVPTIGTAIFTGLASGFYIDAAGTPYFTAAAVSANTNFSTRSMGFTTTNTQAGNLNTGVQAANAGLNLSGTLTWSAGVNQFSGALITANALLNGGATGQFYGPNAEEIGGVFSLSGSGTQRYIGGFGGKR